MIGLCDPNDYDRTSNMPNNIIRWTMPTSPTPHNGNLGYSGGSGPLLTDYAPLMGVIQDMNIYQNQMMALANGMAKATKIVPPKWDGNQSDGSVYQFWTEMRSLVESPGITPQARNTAIWEALKDGAASAVVTGCSADGNDIYGLVMRQLYTRFMKDGALMKYYTAMIKTFEPKGEDWVAQFYTHLESVLRAVCKVDKVSHSEHEALMETCMRTFRRLDARVSYTEKLMLRKAECLNTPGKNAFSIWDFRRFLDMITECTTIWQLDSENFDQFAKKSQKRETKVTKVSASTGVAEEPKKEEVQVCVAKASNRTKADNPKKSVEEKKALAAARREAWLDAPRPTECEACGKKDHISFIDCPVMPLLKPKAKAFVVKASSMCRRCLHTNRSKDHTLDTCTAPLCSCGFSHHKSICFAVKPVNVSLGEVEWEEFENWSGEEVTAALAHAQEIHVAVAKAAPKRIIIPEEEKIVATGAAGQEQRFFSLTGVVQAKHSSKPILARARMMLDNGSDVTFLSDKLAKTLDFKGEKIKLHVTGINGVRMTHPCIKGPLTLRALDGTFYTVEAFTKPFIFTKTLDEKELETMASVFRDVPSMVFDSGFNKGNVDILLGQPALLDCVKHVEKLSNGYGVQHTVFGALPIGPIPARGQIFNMVGATEEGDTLK